MPPINGSIRFTPTEQRMYDLLADGLPHTRRELKACIDDELAELSAIKKHLTNLRKKLADRSEEIVCVFHQRTICYRHFYLASRNGTSSRTGTAG